MAIVIKATKVVRRNGEKLWRIDKVEALPCRKLPPAYLQKGPWIMHVDKEDYTGLEHSAKIGIHNSTLEGQLLSPESMQELLAHCALCGERLMKMRKRARKRGEDIEWQGEETFTI